MIFSKIASGVLMEDKVHLFAKTDLQTSKQLLPLYSTTIKAGFPSPADDYVEKSLDLNELCIDHPETTYFLRVANDGDSMIDIGIYPHDYLVVDRALQARNGDIVIAQVNDGFTVKELLIKPDHIVLHPHNSHYEDIVIAADDELVLFGVVTNIIRSLRK